MTAGEIKEQIAEGKTQIGWLKEIAYQLAVLNEQKAQPKSSTALDGAVLQAELIQRKKHDRK